jgi:menaquinone-dependent protoporphyrinogen IX oxidase
MSTCATSSTRAPPSPPSTTSSSSARRCTPNTISRRSSTGSRRAAPRCITSPTVFFSVSLTAAEDSAAARLATQDCVDVFCAETGWTPGRTECIPGALQYREYNVFTRQLMRLLMKRMGHDTDASHDHDYTDWNAVDRLGREIAALAAVHAA